VGVSVQVESNVPAQVPPVQTYVVGSAGVQLALNTDGRPFVIVAGVAVNVHAGGLELPAPLSAIVGLIAALLLIVTVPVRLSSSLGSKLTSNVHEALAARLLPQSAVNPNTIG
jgi:hypothetical protein